MDPADAMKVVADGSRADREVGGRIVTRLGLGKSVADSVRHIFERWDGQGVPTGVAGEDIPLATRIGHVASVAVMFSQMRGRAEAIDTLRTHGRAACSTRRLPRLSSLTPTSCSRSSTCPTPGRRCWRRSHGPGGWSESGSLDDICGVFADFVD